MVFQKVYVMEKMVSHSMESYTIQRRKDGSESRGEQRCLNAVRDAITCTEAVLARSTSVALNGEYGVR